MFEENKKVSFDDKWESTDAYIEWYATVIQDCFAALKPNGWLYCHNNFDSNALVLGDITKEVRGKFYTNITRKSNGRVSPQYVTFTRIQLGETRFTC